MASLTLALAAMAMTVSAQSGICTRSPYTTLLPLASYEPAMSWCSSNVPLPARTTTTTFTPTTVVTRYTTQTSIVTTLKTKVVPVTSKSVVKTVTVTPTPTNPGNTARNARRQAQPTSADLSSLWNSVLNTAKTSIRQQACSCIETPATTTRTVTAATSTSTTTLTTAVSKTQVVVTSVTSTKVVKGTSTVTVIPTPPADLCEPGATIETNGKRYQLIHNGWFGQDPQNPTWQQGPDYNSFSSPFASTVEDCTAQCAKLGNCCEVHWTPQDGPSGSSGCVLGMNSNGCPNYTPQATDYTCREANTTTNSVWTSSVYIGLTDPPVPVPRQCEQYKADTEWGRRYLQHCNTSITFDPSPSIATANLKYLRWNADSASCVSGCAETNCCHATRSDKSGVATCEIWYPSSGSDCSVLPSPTYTLDPYADSWSFSRNTSAWLGCEEGKVYELNGQRYESHCHQQIANVSYDTYVWNGLETQNMGVCVDWCSRQGGDCCAAVWDHTENGIYCRLVTSAMGCAAVTAGNLTSEVLVDSVVYVGAATGAA